MPPKPDSQDSNPAHKDGMRRIPPRNHRFEQVRSSWEIDLAKANLPATPRGSTSDPADALGKVSVPLSELSTRKRTRIITLLDRRAHIEELATTQAQRTSYSEWISAESERRPHQTISGRRDDPRALPSSFPVSKTKHTGLYEFETSGSIALTPGSIVEFGNDDVRYRGTIVTSRPGSVAVQTATEIPSDIHAGTLREIRYWEDYYVRIRELRHTTFGRKFSTTTIADLWREFPDSKASKFMRAFSRPMDYAFPHLNLDGKLPTFFTREFFDRCSLLPYLVSPDLLPSKLLSDLRLLVWPEGSLRASRVLEMKAEPEIIQGVKMIFEAAQWLRAGNRRMLVIERPVEGRRITYPEAKDIDPSILGSIMYLRGKISGGYPKDKRSEFNPEPITVQFYATVYDAHRRNPHATDSYDDELPLQTEFRAEAEDINQRITRDWSGDQATKDNLTEELSSFAARWSKTFEHAEHRLKSELYEHLKGIIERIPNIKQRIGPIQTKLVAAIKRAEGRSGELPDIQGTMATDDKILESIIQEGEKKIDRVRNQVVNATPLFEKFEDQIFGTDRSATERQSAVRTFLTEARLNLEILNSLRCRPFTVFADKLREAFEDFNGALEKCNRESAKDSLVKLLVITKIAHANAIFERLKFAVSFDKDVTFAQLVESANDLRGVLVERTVLPTRVVESYRNAYEQTEHEAALLVKGFTHYLERGLDLQERNKKYKDIRKFLDRIDLESRVRTL